MEIHCFCGVFCLGVFGKELVLFGCPACSGETLLAGNLKRCHCSMTSSGRKPKWDLSVGGHVAGLLTAGGSHVGLVNVQPVGRVDAPGPGFWKGIRKKIRLTKETTPGQIVGFHHGGQPITKRWERISIQGHASWEVEQGADRRKLALSHIAEPVEIG